MEYTKLGSSGLTVSGIALGTMGFGDGTVPFWSWALPWEDAKPFFTQALDLGINFWDTANVYSAGSSEEIVGKALTETRRDDIVLATKVHPTVGEGPGGSGQLSGASTIPMSCPFLPSSQTTDHLRHPPKQVRC